MLTIGRTMRPGAHAELGALNFPLTKIRQSFAPETAGSGWFRLIKPATFYWRIGRAECRWL
jgi:hypothetical protein